MKQQLYEKSIIDIILYYMLYKTSHQMRLVSIYFGMNTGLFLIFLFSLILSPLKFVRFFGPHL